MNYKKPEKKTREKLVSHLKEACLMLGALNMTLDEAIAFNQHGDWTCLQTPRRRQAQGNAAIAFRRRVPRHQKQNVINHPLNLKTAQITDYITDDYISAFSLSRPRI